MLIEEEAKMRTEAKVRFIEGLWTGKQSGELLSLAAAAGVATATADELLEKVEQAKAMIEHVNQLPSLRKEADAAKNRMEKVRSHADAEITQLTNQVEKACFAASKAREAYQAADGAAQRLLRLYDEGLLPESRMPKEITTRICRRQAEEVARKADSVRIDANNEVERRQSIVARLENQLANLPMSITLREDQYRLERALKTAKAELGTAEDRLKAAKGRADAARKEIS